jgi:S-adenosylhomocysteine hydrolase
MTIIRPAAEYELQELQAPSRAVSADGVLMAHPDLTSVTARSCTAWVRGSDADRPQLLEHLLTGCNRSIPDQTVQVIEDGAFLRASTGTQVRVRVGRTRTGDAHPLDSLEVTLTVEESGDLRETMVGAMLQTVRRLPFTGLEWRELTTQMPLTHELPAHLPAECLEAIAPVFTVHHMSDFLVMLDAARRMGVPVEAMTVIDKGYRYQHAARVDAHLKTWGVAVWPWTATAQALGDHAARAARLGRRGLLIDDGGYTLPVLLRERADLLGSFVGLVEQTISGITKLAPFGEDLPVPVFSVAESRLKASIESYGVADAAVRNIVHLLAQEKFEGQAALVLGFGRIGEQIAAILRDRRMRVAVYDSAIVRLISAHERGFLTDRSLPALLRQHRPLLVIGSTGTTSLRGEHAAALQRDCYLVSTTSRTTEFALEELAEEALERHDAGVLGHRLLMPNGAMVTVLGDGYPINFHYAESMPNKYADLILASLLIGAATLATPGHGFRPGHNREASDQVLEGCGLLERYYHRFGPGTTR